MKRKNSFLFEKSSLLGFSIKAVSECNSEEYKRVIRSFKFLRNNNIDKRTRNMDEWNDFWGEKHAEIELIQPIYDRIKSAIVALKDESGNIDTKDNAKRDVLYDQFYPLHAQLVSKREAIKALRAYSKLDRSYRTFLLGQSLNPPKFPKNCRPGHVKGIGPVVDAGGTGELFAMNVKNLSLKGCGNGDPNFMMKLSPAEMPRGLGEQIYQYMGLTMPCHGLTKGKVVDFLKVCNEFSDEQQAPMTVRLTPWGIPVCWKIGRKWRPPERDEVGWGLNSMPLEGVCDRAYHGRISHEEKMKRNIVSLLKYTVRTFKVECFYIKRDVLRRILNRG